MRKRRVFMIAATWLALGSMAGNGGAAPINSLYNPLDRAPIVTSLDYSSGTLTFNTDTGELTHSVDGVLGTGTVAVANQSGNVQMTVFTFGSVALNTGVTVSVVGNLGLVLASQRYMTIGTTISLNGANASGNTPGLGGPGAEGGVRGTSYQSNPPGNDRGKGGTGSSVTADGKRTGVSYGAGNPWSTSGNVGGRGGSYGGEGGGGNGNTYGSPLLTELYGGSGGGGSTHDSSGCWRAAGGGGGSLLLIASGTLTVTGAVVRAKGGIGAGGQYNGAGGGSGGGIILAANKLMFSGAPTITAAGGDTGWSQYSPGSGGGGGRIAFYANNDLSSHSSDFETWVSVAGGGVSGGAGAPGAAGTFRYHGDGGEGDLSFPCKLMPPRGTVIVIR